VDDDEIRSLCGALAVVRLLVQTKISLRAKKMFVNVNLYFLILLTHYSRDTEIWLQSLALILIKHTTHLSMLISVFRIIGKSQVDEFDQGWS